ncbi:class I SAM-dependent methyltransferase [Mucilaginibacter paludis]|uniref:Methyltransferase type 12 n=1 Tax=Mucilaginibacter paludis DSM 18603 TaxID=714943 RepID=H1Y245_9SPHI|nr:class I SAM-dependent methyltransferase [Mucilaginibacter paludis]EHQ26702.1 Methyltransferase type 12 [Mucilaginibacter paludis DSM 18603]
MTSNYDNSAIFYDRLSRLVFGDALVKAQIYLLRFVPPNSSVLIVGGGTGWILEELSAIHYSGLQITYVEISSQMTALAKKRFTGINKVTYINEAIENTTLNTLYDVLITPFLLDNFTEDTLQKTFSHMHHQLKPKGLWLCADFQITGGLWQKVMLKTMYLLFKIVCRIETLKMPNIEAQFVKYRYRPLKSKTFYGDFMISRTWEKVGE